MFFKGINQKSYLTLKKMSRKILNSLILTKQSVSAEC